MIKVPIETRSVELKKFRNKISLYLRLAVFLSVTITYFILYNYSTTNYDNNNNNNVRIKSSYGKNLLSYIPTEQTENYEISRKNNFSIYEIPEEIIKILNNNTIWTNLTNKINTTDDFYDKTNCTEPSAINEFSNNILIINSTEDFVDEKNCTEPAINEFPNDGLTRQQRKNGWIIIHIILACYCFWMMAIVCDDYFVPSIEMLCKNCQIRKDVVGATFMAAASSSAELFINCVGTFVTKGDIGIGAIIGSTVFNILAVPACCGLFSRKIIKLEWWPISRDCVMYCIAVIALIITLSDGKVMWYEALLLVIAYFTYILAMYCSDLIYRKTYKLQRKKKIRPYREVNEITPLLTNGLSSKNLLIMEPILETPELDKTILNHSQETITSNRSVDYAYDPWTFNNNNYYLLFVYILRWPMTFLFWITIPDCHKHPKLRIITFLFAVCWIGVLSYLVSFLVTLIGDTLNIPDSVMGLTILAVGMSIPEASSSVIVAIKGYGSMGICNSIGSNIFDILLCLGLPWFIKSYWLPTIENEHWIILNSNSLQYSTISLLITLFGLYIAIILNRFRLDWKIGISCSIMYIIFLIIAILIELNYFFDINLPVCDN